MRLVLSTLAVVVLLAVCTPQAGLSATLVDTIDLPPDAEKVDALIILDDWLFVSCPTDDGGLHCYSTNDHSFRWTVSLGVITRPNSDYTRERVPCSWAISTDGSKFLAGVGSGELIAVDIMTGVPEAPVPVPGPRQIFTQVVDGHAVVILVTSGEVRVHDEADLNVVLYQGPLVGSVNGATYDGITDSLYIAIHDPDTLVKYSFDWSGPQFVGIGSSAPSGGWPYNCELVPGNRIAVGCTEGGSVCIHDRATLSLLTFYPGLTRLADIVYLDGRIVLTSYYSPAPGSEDPRGGVMSIDPMMGASQVQYFDDSYPNYIVPAPIPGACVITDAGVYESHLEPYNGRYIRRLDWVNGHLWTFDTDTLSMMDEIVLDGGRTACASGGDQNLVYMFSPDGTAIHAYSIP